MGEQKIADAKLAKDFQAVLKEFRKAQHLAGERKTAYVPFVAQAIIPSRQEVLLLDNKIVFNEVIVKERDQGIQEIQQQIGEVNEIFKDLAVLVHDQGVMIDDVNTHIENSYAATAQACLLLVIFGVVLLIVIIVLTA